MSKSGKVLIAFFVCFLIAGFIIASPALQLFYQDAQPYKFSGYKFTAAFDPIKIATVSDVPENTGYSFSVKLDLPYAGTEKVRQDIFGILTNINGEYHAYSAVCPHLGCIVRWNEEQPPEERIFCNCHNGAFSPTTGEVTAGPPPRALDIYEITVDGEDIYLDSLEGGE